MTKNTKDKADEKQQSANAEVSTTTPTKDCKKCGIVMPIAAMTHAHEDYTESHWIEVRDVIIEACIGFETRLVSENKTSGLIIADIVENLYKDDIVICDISGRNPNVFFELGLRLTFDKPTIILRDDVTIIPFDIQGVRIIQYPVGLNYHRINKLKKDIKDAIDSTFVEFEKARPNTFLNQFKDLNIQPAQLEKENVTYDEVRMIRIENQLTSIIDALSAEKAIRPLRGININTNRKTFSWERDFNVDMVVKFVNTNVPLILQSTNFVDSSESEQKEIVNSQFALFLIRNYNVSSLPAIPPKITDNLVKLLKDKSEKGITVISEEDFDI